MLFHLENETQLKAWLEEKLVQNTEAEASILAEYCIALLKHDEEESKLRLTCIEQLTDFLKDETSSFVNDVFEYLRAHFQQDRKENETVAKDYDSGYTSREAQSRSRNITEPVKVAVLYEPRARPAIIKPSSKVSNQYREPNRKRKHCFAFQRDGYCPKGKTCLYEHVFNITQQKNTQEYDPTHYAMSDKGFQESPASLMQSPKNLHRSSQSIRNSGSTHAARTLVIENIPSQFFTKNHVRHEFSRYGPIEDVNLGKLRVNCTISFRTVEALEAAYTSSKPLFDNRFVMLFRAQDRDLNIVAPDNGQPNSREGLQQSNTQAQRARKFLDVKNRADLLAQQHTELKLKQEENESLLKSLEASFTEVQSGRSGIGVQRPSDHRFALEQQLKNLKEEANQLGVIPYQKPGRLRNGSLPRVASTQFEVRRTSPYNVRPRSLDNRSRAIQVHLEEGAADHFASYVRREADYEYVHTVGSDVVMIGFKTRRAAELFSCLKSINGVTPQKMSWILPVARAPQDTQMAQNTNRFERYIS